MKTSEVPEFLNISRATLYNYRRKLNILDETRHEVTESHLESFRRLRDARAKPVQVRQKEKEIRSEAEEAAINDGFLVIHETDATQTINLKKQYNGNQLLINHLDNLISLDIQKMNTPEKVVADMMEKYQKLNMSLIRQIESLNPAEDDLKQKIEQKLSQYT